MVRHNLGNVPDLGAEAEGTHAVHSGFFHFFNYAIGQSRPEFPKSRQLPVPKSAHLYFEIKL